MEKTANEDLPALTVFLEKTELTERTVSTERTVNQDNKDLPASAARMVNLDPLGRSDQLEKTELKVHKVINSRNDLVIQYFKDSKETEERRVSKASQARMACILTNSGTHGET